MISTVDQWWENDIENNGMQKIIIDNIQKIITEGVKLTEEAKRKFFNNAGKNWNPLGLAANPIGH